MSYKAVAVVEDEYLNHPDKALEVAEKGIALASDQKHVLEDQKAMIFYRQNKYPEALKIWGRILPNWPVQRNSHEMQPLFVCQRAGKLSGDTEGRIRQTLNSDRADIYRIYKDTTQGRLVRMIAALQMAIDTETGLISMFLGQASLLSGLTSGGFKDEASQAMGKIVKRTWKKRLSFPAEFPTPRITIPAIQVACDESVEGFRLASRILLQARFAVPSLRIPLETLQQLEALAR